VILIDFGIARALESARHTSARAFMGSWEYVAPERWKGQPGQAPADIYALGILTYYLLAGHPPFRGHVTALSYAHVHIPPPPLHDIRPDLSAWLCAGVERALAKDPRQRPARAAHFARALVEAAPHSTGFTSATTARSVRSTERITSVRLLPARHAQPRRATSAAMAGRSGRPPTHTPLVRQWRRRQRTLWAVGALLAGLVLAQVISSMGPSNGGLSPTPLSPTPASRATGTVQHPQAAAAGATAPAATNVTPAPTSPRPQSPSGSSVAVNAEPPGPSEARAPGNALEVPRPRERGGGPPPWAGGPPPWAGGAGR